MKSEDGLKHLIEESGIGLDSEIAHQLLTYLALLEKWGSRMNLTGSIKWVALEPLFHEGIWVSGIYPPKAICHLDIGSGAGFPAVILKILIPRIRLEMVESRAKKSAFLETVANALGLGDTFVYAARLEDYLRCAERKGIWDCVSWKGLKLSSRDLVKLRQLAHQDTQFWIFHGKELALEEPEQLSSVFEPVRNEKIPGRKHESLSIFRVSSHQ